MSSKENVNDANDVDHLTASSTACSPPSSRNNSMTTDSDLPNMHTTSSLTTPSTTEPNKKANGTTPAAVTNPSSVLRLGETVALKFLVSALYCGSVIGKGGENITSFQEKSKAQILVSQNNDYFPGSNRERIVLVQSKKTDEIISAIALMLNCIDDEHESYTNKNNELTFKLVVPELSTGVIIGNDGGSMKELTSQKVKISLHKMVIPSLHEIVLILTGTIDSIVFATKVILQKLVSKNIYYHYVSTNYQRCHLRRSFRDNNSTVNDKWKGKRGGGERRRKASNNKNNNIPYSFLLRNQYMQQQNQYLQQQQNLHQMYMQHGESMNAGQMGSTYGQYPNEVTNSQHAMTAAYQQMFQAMLPTQVALPVR